MHLRREGHQLHEIFHPQKTLMFITLVVMGYFRKNLHPHIQHFELKGSSLFLDHFTNFGLLVPILNTFGFGAVSLDFLKASVLRVPPFHTDPCRSVFG